jgi:putative redox protein
MAEPRKAIARLVGLNGMAFNVETGSGHTVALDATPEHGGQGAGPSPMETLLVGLAGCTGMDVIALLRKMRQDVTSYEVLVLGFQRDEHPRVFASVEVEHRVRGRGLAQAMVEKAVNLSATRYCGASATLAGVGDVRHRVTIEEG